MPGTLTSTSATLMLTVPAVFPTSLQIMQWAADDAWTVEKVTPTEARKGVDNVKSSGYTPYMPKFAFVLMATSPSVLIMDTWANTMQQALEDYTCSITLAIPGIKRIYTGTNGSLTGYTPAPAGKKLLEPLNYEITLDTFIPVGTP
jgi:hypothetical protein